MKEHKSFLWIRVLALAAIAGGSIIVLYETDLLKFFLDREHLTHFLDSLGSWGFAGFVLLQALQVIVAPIPGDVTGLMGGFLYGPIEGTVLSTLGLTAGSCFAFAVARFFGRPVVEKFVPPPAMKRFNYLLHHKGAFLVFLLFLIPGFPKDYLCYLLGLGHLSATEFVVFGGSGRLFGTILLSVGGNFIRLHQYARFFVLIAVALVVVLAVMACRERLEGFFRQWHMRIMAKETVRYLPDRQS